MTGDYLITLARQRGDAYALQVAIDDCSKRAQREHELERRTYIVVRKDSGIERHTAAELIGSADMRDCYDPWAEGDWSAVYYNREGTLRPVQIEGPHRHAGDPLRIAIVDAETREELDFGYGTDH